MDTSATALMHDIGEILDDHKSQMIIIIGNNTTGIKTAHLDVLDKHSELLKEIEIEHDRMVKDIKGLFSSSYSFNK
tara:strand:- start:777 stop:1004 length:228 start_codon:yes stop_codon:yes gene_type:complete